MEKLGHPIDGDPLGPADWLKAVTEGQWAVCFEHLELGLFDERLGRVLPD